MLNLQVYIKDLYEKNTCNKGIKNLDKENTGKEGINNNIFLYKSALRYPLIKLP